MTDNPDMPDRHVPNFPNKSPSSVGSGHRQHILKPAFPSFLGKNLSNGSDDILFTRATHRGDTGTAPIYIIGGILFFAGLAFVFGFNFPDIGLMMSGIGMVLIRVQEKPKLNFRYVRYTGLPGLVLFMAGLLLFIHVI